MHRAFVQKPWIDSYLKNQAHPLPLEVANRFFKVLRLKADEQVGVFDGHGREVRGLLAKIETGAFFTKACLHEEKPFEPSITLMQAAIEESKISETIKRGTEFGFDKFIIFNAEHSERYCFDKLKKREERLNLLAIDASRQSGRLFVPQIEFADSLTLAIKDKTAIFGDPHAQFLLSEVLATKEFFKEIVVLIGPEGGFSKAELLNLQKAQAISTRFAPYTLRSELASLAAIALVNARLKRA